MRYVIDLSEIKTFDLFDKILSIDRKTNLFNDLRKLYAEKVKRAILTSGIIKVELIDYVSANPNINMVQISPIPSLYNSNEILDVDFCARYGIGGALSAISYQHGIYCDLPSLDTFVKRKNFSIGNFGFLVNNGDYEIEIITNDDVKIVGYSYQISAKKRKPFIAIFGVHFDYNSILQVANKYNTNTTTLQLVDVMAWGTDFPQIFMCRITGKFYICNCFKNYIDWKNDFFRVARGLYENEITNRIDNITYLDKICHYCNKTTPITQTALSGYSDFLLRYAPYFHLECKKRYGTIYHFVKEDRVNLENELREHWGYPKIGEKWTTETHLYYLFKEIFPNNQIIFHYRGKEMNKLEIDIFIPELKLAIEYQGIQHYSTVEHWGGKEGLKQRQKNDIIKAQLCKENDYNLVEFFYHDEISRDLVIERIEQYTLIENYI